MVCEGQKTAKVEFTFADNTKISVISNNPGVNVTLTPVVTSGQVTIHVIGTAYAAGCVILTNHDEIYGTSDASANLSLIAIDNNSCRNGAYYQIPGVSAGNGTVWLAGTVTLVKDAEKKTGCQLIVTDASGVIFDKTINQACPIYKIACGDECPNGYCKIDCETYPGYCCISEAEIQGFINGLK